MAHEDVTLTRDVQATEIPYGGVHILRKGSRVRITQSLGGSYTVNTDMGYMVRIEPRDADALGKTQQAQSATATPGQFSEKLVWEQLKSVYDPEIPVNVVDLGLIYRCDITQVEGGHKIEVDMTMTAPGCGMGDILKTDIERKLMLLPGVKEVHAQIVFDPPWNPSRMSEAARLQLGIDLDYGSGPSSMPMMGR
jgi:probable FeS assembly SUF system protein SufT